LGIDALIDNILIFFRTQIFRYKRWLVFSQPLYVCLSIARSSFVVAAIRATPLDLSGRLSGWKLTR